MAMINVTPRKLIPSLFPELTEEEARSAIRFAFSGTRARSKHLKSALNKINGINLNDLSLVVLNRIIERLPLNK